MVIDFPLEIEGVPTECLALGIDASKISDVVYKFSDAVAIEQVNNRGLCFGFSK